MRRPAVVVAIIGVAVFATAFIAGRVSRSSASPAPVAATVEPAPTPAVIAKRPAKPAIDVIEPARLPSLAREPRQSAPPSSTPVPPSSTPVPPSSTPVPPSSTPVPPSSTPVPTPGCDPC